MVSTELVEEEPRETLEEEEAETETETETETERSVARTYVFALVVGAGAPEE